MYKIVKLISVLPVFFLFTFLIFNSVRAVSESDCLNKSVSELSSGDMDVCINDILPRIAAAYAPAQEKNKANLANLKKQIDSLNSRIISISKELDLKQKSIQAREKDVAYAQEILNQKAVSQYVTARLYDPLITFLSSSDAVNAFKTIKIKEMVAEEDRKTIQKYSEEIIKLKNDKDSLEKNKSSLASLQKKVSEDAKFLEVEVGKVDSFLSILSSKQQEILNAKSGSFITSVGDIELADDYNASIKGFRDSAPSGSFAVFSFGGYTHRKGMSQYGARGRAQNNQNANQILKAYYGKEPVTKNTGGDINIAGVGNRNFEDYYLMGIAEMPSTWHVEALKAQAIAARTYAYRYKVEGKSICTTESCQVFKSSKANNPPDAWKQAVQATRGQVLEDVVTYYSSTAGGYSTTSGWDTTDGSGGGSFIDKTYEKLGGSPWLYKAWYRQGYTSSGATCGQSDPWLTNEEFTDIVNAALVLRNGNDGRVVPVVSCPVGNPYSYSELREKGGVSSVSSVSVSQGNGVTNNVNINGNINLTGIEFKKAFNLRAPGYLKIPQGSGFGSTSDFAFFNIEKK